MGRAFVTLGIETSCDDTALALLDGSHRILAEYISSQIKDHEPFGGVVPEFASRKHLESFLPLLRALLARAGINNPARQIDLVAVTAGPGLMGSLLVGVMAAKGLSQAWETPLIGVNHLEGHIFANRVNFPELVPPFLCMIVSGGHTEIILVKAWGDYSLLGATRDDAAGEAYDKAAKLMGLGYPGGPMVDKLSQEGDPSAFSLPIPLKNTTQVEFSFSGLKTAVLWEIRKIEEKGQKLPVKDLCSSFQKAVVNALITKLQLAVGQSGINKVAVSGGVAANSGLRKALEELKNLEVFIPPVSHCTDNGVMVAAAGYNCFKRGLRSDLSLSPDPSWEITPR
ncbi:MAG: tRNA (adenosine(37)-N6)-threonylcarbamoyltransferase complex transferase subunit TsaD [Synergistales bacterium]|nr:tRNA (adenosine(37)-N6)-threonylcarbamoyltransferase complex transferase subunit TsaD [Synergistales bacterium]